MIVITIVFMVQVASCLATGMKSTRVCMVVQPQTILPRKGCWFTLVMMLPMHLTVLDGTLWHTSDVILPIWNEVLKNHPETQKQITLEEMNSYMGKTIEQIANIMLPELSEENGVNIIKECCAVEVPYLEKSGGHLYDNLEDVLSKLSEKYFLGIISNCQCGYIESFLKAHKLEKYFSDFEMSGRTQLTKGENISLVISRNNIDCAFYVGETIGDQTASKDAKVPFVFAEYGFGNTENPKYIIHTFSELLEISEKVFAEN